MQKLRPIRPSTPRQDAPRPVATVLAGLPSLPRRGYARILDLDSECRPDAYLGPDFTTRALTGIAARFIGESEMWCRVINASSPRTFASQARLMLTEFLTLYDQADMVTGHNIRRHDLPIINASLIYFGLPQLSPKKTQDTLQDMPRAAQVFSRSQENLGDLFEALTDKYHMNNARWKRANLLEDVSTTRDRVVTDVEMHIDLRQRMLDAGVLTKATRWWRPT